MSVLEKLQVIAPDGKIEFFDLDPRKGLATFGQPAGYDPSLGIPLAVPFQILFNLQKTPNQVKVLSARTPARLNGQVLSTNRYYELMDCDSLEVDGFTLLILESVGIPAPAYTALGQIQAGAPEPAALAPEIPIVPIIPASSLVSVGLDENADPNMMPPDIRDDNIIANLTANYWTVDVENAATCEVEIRNNFKQTASFEVRVEGRENDIEDWTIAISPRIVNLNSGDTKTVKVAITPPRKPSSAAGPHPLAFIVTSPEFPSNRRQMGAMLVIKPYFQFNTEKLSPIHETGTWFNPNKRASFAINNLGNSTARFSVQSTDDESNSLIKFPQEAGRAPVQLREVEVAPRGDPRVVPLLITPQHRPALIGLRAKQFKYTVTTISQDNPTNSQPLSGTYTSNPVLGRIFILAFFIIALVCLAVVGFLVLRPRIDDFKVANSVIRQGESADLRWAVSPFTTNVKIEGVVDPISGSQGQVSVVPTTSASTYTLIASNWLSRMLRMEDLTRGPLTVLSIPAYPEIVTLTVNRTDVFQSDEITVKWSVRNADEASLTVEGVTTTLKGDQLNGEQKFQLKGDTLVVLTAKNNSGTVTRSEFVRARPIKITINNFTVSQREIVKGDPVTIAWDVSGEGIQTVTISPFKDALPLTGSLQFFPQGSTEFVLTVTARDQQEIRLLSVGVLDKIVPTAPTVDIFKVAPEAMAVGGGPVEFSWSVGGQTTNIQITGKEGVLANNLPAQGFRTFNVTSSANFILIAYNGNLTASKDAKVTVAQPKKNVIVSIVQIAPHEGNVIRKGSLMDVYISVLADNGSGVGVQPSTLGWPEITGTIQVSDGLNDCTKALPSTFCEIAVNQFPPQVIDPAGYPSGVYTPFTASYKGDDNYGVKYSGTKYYHFIYEANSVILTTTLTPATIFTGDSFTLKIKATPTDPAATAPVTGAVVVKQGPNAFCTITLATDPGNPLAGTGTCAVHPTLPFAGQAAGQNILMTLMYSGNGDYNPYQDTTNIFVNKALTQISSSTVFGASRPYKDTVTVSFNVSLQPAGGVGIPTGKVRVMDKDALDNYCEYTLVLADNGSGSCGLMLNNLGSRQLVFSYTSDNGQFADIAAAPTPFVPVTVTMASTTTTITSVTPLTVLEVGQSVNVAFQVTGDNATHTLPPNGTVNVYLQNFLSTSSVTAVPDCSITISNGLGSCVVTLTQAGTVHFYAQYMGDTTPPTYYNVSPNSALYPVPPALGTAIAPAETQTNITSISPSSPGDPGVAVTVKYEVKTVRTSSLQPASGFVDIYVNGIASACHNDLSATDHCVITLSTPGANAIQVRYAGSSNYAISNSSDSHYLIRQTTSISVTGPLTSQYIDQPINFSVTLTPGGDNGQIKGTITVEGASLAESCTIPLDMAYTPSYTNSCNITFTSGGARSVTATFTPHPSSNYVQKTSGPFSYTALKDKPIITNYTHAPNPSTVGQPVTVGFTVLQQHTTQAPTPTGTVTVTASSGEHCTATLNAADNGSKSCSLTFLHGSASPVSITVSYDGATDVNQRYESSDPVTFSGGDGHTVNAAGTSTVLGAPGSIAVGQTVTITATVTPSIAAGNVNFTATHAGSPNQSCSNVAVSGGLANCSMTFPAQGTWAIHADFVPTVSADYSSSYNDLNKTVNPANTTTTVVGSPSPSIIGESVTFTATVTTNPVNPINPVTPQGTVTFTISKGATTLTCLHVALVQPAGTAACSQILNSVGSWDVSATYEPTADFSSLNSGTTTQTVTTVATTTIVTPSGTSSDVGVAVIFTATVSGSVTPTGTVTFTYTGPGAVPECNGISNTVTLDGTGHAQCSLTFMTVGAWNIAAQYNPDPNFHTSSDPNTPHTVKTVTTSFTLTPDPVSGVSWFADMTQSFSFNLVYTSSLVPSGTLRINATSSTGGHSSCQLSLPTTTGCSITIDRADSWTLAASYNGDSKFAGFNITPTVTSDLTTPTISMSLVKSSNNKDLDVSVTVTGNTPLLHHPTGQVNITVTGQTLTCNGNLNASGTMSCSLGNFFVDLTNANSPYTVVATYVGDTNFKTVNTSQTQTVP